MVSRLSIGLALFVFASISPLAAEKNQQLPQTLSVTHGYLFVSFPKGGTPIVYVREVKSKVKHNLRARKDPGKTAFGLWVPAGEYTLDSVDGNELKDSQPFQVDAGTVTNLGGLLPFNIGGYQLVVIPLRHSELAHDVDTAINEFRPYLKTDTPIEWRPTSLPQPVHIRDFSSSGFGIVGDVIMAIVRENNKPAINSQLKSTTSVEDFYRLAFATLPPMYEEATADENSSLYFGADLGQIRMRRSDGTWTALDTETLSPISAVEFQGELLVAGTEDGTIRASANKGSSWRLMKSLSSDEAIVDIDYAVGKWLITSAAQIKFPDGSRSTNRVRIYSGQTNDFSDLSIIADLAVDPKKITDGWFGTQGQAFGNLYFVSTYNALHRINLDTNEITTLTLPNEFTGFTVSSQSGIISGFKAKGMFSKLIISTDQGNHWKPLKAPPYVILNVHFVTPESAWAARWNTGAFGGIVELYSYDKSKDR